MSARRHAGLESPLRRLSGRWRAAAAWHRAVAVAVAAVVAAALLVVAIDALYPSPGGPRSSSYATGPDGLAAYASLLREHGYEVERLRVAPGEATLDARATVVLLDPDAVLPEDAEALGRFVERGGRLVAGGPAPTWVNTVLADPPTWSPTGIARAGPVGPGSDGSGVQSVATAGDGSWEAPGQALPVLGDEARSLVVVASPGDGSAVLLADASPLQNRLLASEDNAALALALAGVPRRPVTFVESVHGFGSERGLAALPGRWKLALAGLGLAALLYVFARGRRLGPPEEGERPLLPPRRAYVEALAAALERTGSPWAASAPVRRRARELLAAQTGMGTDAAGPQLERAARHLGLDAGAARALAGAGDGEEAALAAGRALAALERGTEVVPR